MAKFGLPVHTLLNSVRDEKKESTDKQKHKCLHRLVTPVHNHAEHFAVAKIALPYLSGWYSWLGGDGGGRGEGWGGVGFAMAYYKCAVPKHHLFIPRRGHRWEVCKRYAHKYYCVGTSAVNSTLLAPWCTSCSITQLSHNCLLYLLDDALRLFQAVLFLLVLNRKKQ